MRDALAFGVIAVACHACIIALMSPAPQLARMTDRARGRGKHDAPEGRLEQRFARIETLLTNMDLRLQAMDLRMQAAELQASIRPETPPTVPTAVRSAPRRGGGRMPTYDEPSTTATANYDNVEPLHTTSGGGSAGSATGATTATPTWLSAILSEMRSSGGLDADTTPSPLASAAVAATAVSAGTGKRSSAPRDGTTKQTTSGAKTTSTPAVVGSMGSRAGSSTGSGAASSAKKSHAPPGKVGGSGSGGSHVASSARQPPAPHGSGGNSDGSSSDAARQTATARKHPRRAETDDWEVAGLDRTRRSEGRRRCARASLHEPALMSGRRAE